MEQQLGGVVAGAAVGGGVSETAVGWVVCGAAVCGGV